jgi:hypothetical protein
MEYQLFDNCIPIGTSNGQYLDFHGYNTPPSDSSMDTDIRESMKLKDAQVDEFFQWSNEMKTTLDEERNPFVLNGSSNGLEDGRSQYCKEYSPGGEIQTKSSDGYSKLKLSKGVVMKDKFGYEKDEDQKTEKDRKSSEKAELDMYLDKAHMKIAKSLGCEMENQENLHSPDIPRKRKLEAPWQQSKIRSGMSQREY